MTNKYDDDAEEIIEDIKIRLVNASTIPNPRRGSGERGLHERHSITSRTRPPSPGVGPHCPADGGDQSHYLGEIIRGSPGGHADGEADGGGLTRVPPEQLRH